ncbi:MAG: hypothetical protein JJU20_01840 [Opitutales bacterium]|nr:hypothetical protein [Opitutales bacterium]
MHLLNHTPATRSEVESVLRCESPQRPPLFLPAIYEHKASFIGSSPSAISRDAKLLTKALLAEFEAVQADALTVGVDVYNIEAEAIGCKLTCHDSDDFSIPGIKPGGQVLHVGDDIKNAKLPNPLMDGRMPVNIAAARDIRKALGDAFWIRGAVCGPFSLAVSLVGAEELFMACLDDPEWVQDLLAYTSRIVREFSKAYLDVGVELIIFDSQASPDLLSPSMFRQFVLPATQGLIQWAADQGLRDIPLVIGGNTTPIAQLLIKTGANNLLCDFTGDLDEWINLCRSHNRALRRNIAPGLIENNSAEEIYAATKAEVASCIDLPGFILGTAVIPFATPTEKILAVRKACIDSWKNAPEQASIPKVES